MRALAQPEDEASEASFGPIDPRDGLGYSIGRTHTAATLARQLGVRGRCRRLVAEHFNLRRTEQYILPALRRATRSPRSRSRCSLRLAAAGVDEDERRETTRAQPERRPVWPIITRWIQEVEASGVPIWGLTVQNEPAAVQVDSCIYTAEEEHCSTPRPACRRPGDAFVVYRTHELAFERGATVSIGPGGGPVRLCTGVHWYSGDYFDRLSS